MQCLPTRKDWNNLTDDDAEVAVRAVTVEPGKPGTARVEDRPAPEPAADELLVEAVALGICGTDREIAAGEYGWAPEGQQRLVLGHESLGRVRLAPAGSGWSEGDLVAGVVRRPDPVPCGACAVGEFDMCRNGRYQERGIKELDGYGAELWTVPLSYAVHVDGRLDRCGVLMEPTSVVAKAWEQVDRVGGRAWFEPRTALVTGAGPIGLLSALIGVQRGLEVHVLDRVTSGPKPDLVAQLGATYHSGTIDDLAQRLRPDVVIEATGVPALIFDAMTAAGAYGVVCLTGVSPKGRSVTIDAGSVNRELVLENDVVVGSVNANQRHYQAAAEVLAAAEHDWLQQLITRQVPVDRFAEALEPAEEDIKVVLTF